VLVTGGAGFIGSHLVDRYLARGDRVTVVDDLSTGDRRNVNPRAELIVADIREFDLRPLQPDIVSHHAAQMNVRRSVADPAFDAEVNIVGSVRLLQQSLEAGVKRFIFASSGGAIYGEPVEVPQSEQHPLNPISPYGCAKLAVEQYDRYFREVHGLSAISLRNANVYGQLQNAQGEAGAVAIFARKMLAGDPVTINGDGEQTRDFVYIDDVVAANLQVSDASDAGPFNVGTGVETSINTLFSKLAALAGSTSPASHAAAKAGEQRRSVLASSALRAGVELKQGLVETLQWFKTND
jgi:UDP-glucose 4-epimerase